MKFRFSSVPYIVWSVIFVVVPLILVAVFGLSTSDGQSTFANVAKVSDYTAVFVRSIWLSLVATAICLVIAYPLGFIMSRYNANNQRTLVMLVMLPMWTNFLLRTYAWMTLLENNGVINSILEFFGIGPFKIIYTQGAVVLGMVYNYLPFMVIPLYSIMTKIRTLHAGSCRGPRRQPVEHLYPCGAAPFGARYHHRNHHGIRAVCFHLHHFPYAGRRLQYDGR